MPKLIYVGFNSKVIAVDRQTGQVVWDWKSRKGTGYASLLLDDDRVIVSIMGYTYCLDATTGTELWFNPFEGYGVGRACLACTTSHTNNIAAIRDIDGSSS